MKKIDSGKNVWGKTYKIIVDKRKKLYTLSRTDSDNVEILNDKINLIISMFFLDDDDDDIDRYDSLLGVTQRFRIDNQILDRLINKLKHKKANGLHKIPNRLIKLIHETNPRLLLKIYHIYIDNLIFPEVWKTVKLVLFNKLGID